MKRITSMMSQWRADTQSGEDLIFENCKGGYFSDKDEYGLKVTGKVLQDGIPTPDNPVAIQCVKAGTKIMCGNEITVPCDLYEGDIWYPMSGKVERSSFEYIFTGNEQWTVIDYIDGGETIRAYTSAPVISGFNAFNPEFRGHFEKAKINPTYASIVECGHFYNAYSSAIRFYLKIYLHRCANPDSPHQSDWQKICTKGTKAVGYRITPIMEQYEPQRIFAPMGSVNVLQEPLDLAADLSATMLVRR